MAELPRTIAGWEEPLAILREELSEALGDWMPSLAGLVGPMRRRDRSGRVTVDGVSGLSRRGSYERLLVSEWAIARAAPLEFLRRAASTEHLFTDLERREPAGSQRCVVLVDAGPDQLGAPRIVQLAALIVLGRRAALADAAVAWGVLQRTAHAPWDAIDPVSLKHMLRQRSPNAPTAEGLASWLEHAEHPQPGDELWLVGSAGLQALAPRGAHLLLIDDADHPDGAVTVTAARAGTGGGRRSVSLPLPAARLQPMLLKDPFRPPPQPKLQTDAPGGVVGALRPSFRFSHSGTRLLAVEAHTGDVLAIRVPHQGRAIKVERAPFSAHEEVVGLGYHQAPYVLTRRDSGELVLSSKKRQEEILSVSASIPAALDPRAPTTALQLRHRSSRRTRFLVGELLYDYNHNTCELSVAAYHCLAAWLSDGQACHLGDQGEGLALTRYTSGGIRDLRLLIPAEGRAAFVGFQRSGSPGLVVLNTEGSQWQVIGPSTAEVLQAPRGSTVLGCMAIGKRSDRPALLVLSEDGATLALVRPDMSQALPTELGRVIHAAASHSRPEVAWMTEDGTLTIWNVALEQRVGLLTAEARA